MANIKLNLPGEPFTKQIVTFTAPCNCDQVTDGLVINGETYTVCDAMGECVTGKGGAWIAGAQISVVLDCENKKAFIQNAATSNLAEALQSHIDNQNNPHNVTAEQLGAGRIYSSSYVGTGTWVSGTPLTFTFDFEPNFVAICEGAVFDFTATKTSNFSVLVCTKALSATANTATYTNSTPNTWKISQSMKKSEDGKTVYLYGTYSTWVGTNWSANAASSAAVQLNASGATYYVVAW